MKDWIFGIQTHTDMKRIFNSILMLASAILLPQAVLAHEGHGHENPLSPGHYIANPEHFIPLALAVAAVVAFVVVRFYKAGSKQKK
jgi:hypothetical protein